MKKTLIALIAMASAAFGADYTAETIWTLDFGSEYTNGYSFVAEEGYSISQTWDIVAVNGGNQSSQSKRAHLRGVFGSWDTDFVLTLNVTLGESLYDGSKWPVFAEIGDSSTNLRFGPYQDVNNTVAMDGSLTKGTNNLVSVEAGGTYTITLTKIGNDVTLAVDGVDTGYGTINATGNITNFTLGGAQSGYYKINEVVHSASMAVLTPVTPAVPEPATATLSLLALAGLAARRRR